jgi:hypothetical protein
VRLLLLLLLPTLALAGPMQDMDRILKNLEAFALPAEPSEAKAALIDLMALMKGLEAEVPAASETHPDRARLRFAEGNLLAADAFLTGPCPESLDAEQCTLYSTTLGDYALPFLERADAALESVDVANLPARERRRHAASVDATGVALLQIKSARATRRSSKPPPATGNPRLITKPLGRAIPWSAAPADAGWALLWRDAEFEGAGQRVRGKETRRSPAAPKLWLVRLIGDDPDHEDRTLVQLGHDFEQEEHCHSSTPLPTGWQVTFSVASTDVLPVLAVDVDLKGKEGTSAQLDAGAPVFEGGVLVGDVVVPVDADDVDVRDSYRADPVRLPQYGAGARFAPDSVLLFDGRPVGLQPVGQHDPVIAAAWDESAGLATFEKRCGVVTVRVESTSTKPAASDPVGFYGKRGGGSHPTYAAEGSVVYSPQGVEVGRLGKSVLMDPMVEGFEGQVCSTLDFGPAYPTGSAEEKLLLCVDKAALQ